MADCAAVGCSEPALDVWVPNSVKTTRFHYLVCEFHALALRSDARFTADGGELHIGSLSRLIDWTVSQAGGLPIVRLVHGDELKTTIVDFQAEPSMLHKLGESLIRILQENDSDILPPSEGRITQTPENAPDELDNMS
jgi:hypothetical protein